MVQILSNIRSNHDDLLRRVKVRSKLFNFPEYEANIYLPRRLSSRCSGIDVLIDVNMNASLVAS